MYMCIHVCVYIYVYILGDPGGHRRELREVRPVRHEQGISCYYYHYYYDYYYHQVAVVVVVVVVKAQRIADGIQGSSFLLSELTS